VQGEAGGGDLILKPAILARYRPLTVAPARVTPVWARARASVRLLEFLPPAGATASGSTGAFLNENARHLSHAEP
jgi:hypothetical protein